MTKSRIRTMIAAPLALVLAACGNASEYADKPLTDVTEAAAAGSEAAMRELEKRAKDALTAAQAASPEGDPETAFQNAFYSGDLDKVAKLAEDGNVFASVYQANMIQMRSDVTDDERNAARAALEQAASDGHAHAIYLISEDYLDEKGLYPIDYDKAFEMGEDAAEAGYMEAMFRTGVRYQYGHVGAPQDDAKALEWLTKAKEAGHRQAQMQLDELAAKAG